MRKTIQILFIQSNLLKDLFHHFPAFFLSPHFIHLKRGTDQIINGHSGIQGAIWILENNLQLPAHFPHFFLIIGKDVFPIVHNLALCCRDQAENSSSQSGFSAAGLSDQAQCLTLSHRKTYMVYCFYYRWITVQKPFFCRKIFG